MSAIPPGWHPDPVGRHEHRYWDGMQWTDHVADQGQMGTDPLQAAPPEETRPAGPSMVNLPAINPADLQVSAQPAAAQAAPTPTPAPTPEPAPAEPDYAPAAAEPAHVPSATGAGFGHHPILGALLSVAAPGSGHVYLGVRTTPVGFGLLGAFLVAIIVDWFISWPVGGIIYLLAAGYALFDLRAEVGPAALRGEAALDDIDDPLAWRIVGAGGIALIIGLVLPWYRLHVSFAGQSESSSANGFDIGWPKIVLLVLAIGALVVAAINVTQSSPQRSSLPPQLPLVLAGVGALAWLLTVWRMLDVPGDSGLDAITALAGGKVDVGIGRGIGAWLGYASTLAIAAGAFAVVRKPPSSG